MARAGDVIDRIVAIVNGHTILQSDWDEALGYEALAEHRVPGEPTAEQRKATLDRLIDQELIREQMRSADFQHATSTEVDRRVADIRGQYSEITSEEMWRAVLREYGLAEAELRDKVSVELDEMRAIDARLRPSIQVDSRSVEKYYREKLLPELRQSGAREVALAEVAPKIREILAQQKINDLLVSWLQNLRSESTIRKPQGSANGSGGGGR
jgi:hypothetical protein